MYGPPAPAYGPQPPEFAGYGPPAPSPAANTAATLHGEALAQIENVKKQAAAADAEAAKNVRVTISQDKNGNPVRTVQNEPMVSQSQRAADIEQEMKLELGQRLSDLMPAGQNISAVAANAPGVVGGASQVDPSQYQSAPMPPRVGDTEATTPESGEYRLKILRLNSLGAHGNTGGLFSKSPGGLKDPAGADIDEMVKNEDWKALADELGVRKGSWSLRSTSRLRRRSRPAPPPGLRPLRGPSLIPVKRHLGPPASTDAKAQRSDQFRLALCGQVFVKLQNHGFFLLAVHGG